MAVTPASLSTHGRASGCASVVSTAASSAMVVSLSETVPGRSPLRIFRLRELTGSDLLYRHREGITPEISSTKATSASLNFSA